MTCHVIERAAVPADFAETYVAGGWRAIDRRYGAKTSRLWEWIRLSRDAIVALSDRSNKPPAEQ